MTYIINDEEINKIKNLEGEVRGAVFKTDEFYLLKEKEKEGIKKTEEALMEMGIEINYESMGKMEYYPISLRILSLLAIAKIFNYGKEEIITMGRKAPRVSFLIKFFTQYFMSSEKTLERVDELWKKHYTKGRIEIGEINENEGFAIFRIYDANFHPIFCDYLSGYLATVVSMVVGKETKSEETKCSFRGDDFHEYYLSFDPIAN